MSEEALLGELYRDVLTRVDADVARHRNLIWNACITLLADSLRHADFFTRERLLRGLVPELRDSMARLSQLLDGQDGGGEIMAPPSASAVAAPDSPTAAPATVTRTAKPSPQPPTERKKRPEKYPIKFHLSITHAMNNALTRMSGGDNSLTTGAQIGRMALHQWLLANDPYYARQFGIPDRRQG